MSKKQKIDPLDSSPLVSTDELGIIVSFVDSVHTFINLSMVNKQVHRQCAIIEERSMDRISLYRGFGVDPRLALIRAQSCGQTLPKWSEEILQSGLELLIYYKTFFRSPGGNCDEFILKYQVSIKGQEMKVIRSKVQNADASYYLTHPFESKVERNPTNLLRAIEKQSFENKTSYDILKVNTEGHTQDYFYTIFDECHGDEEFNTDEYEGVWSFVNLDVLSNKEKIFSIVRRAVHEGNLNTNPYDSNPVTEKFFQELQDFCGVKSIPECEHDESGDYGRSSSGLEMEKHRAQDVEVDEEETDNDHVRDILHRLIDKEQVPGKKSNNDEEEEDDEE